MRRREFLSHAGRISVAAALGGGWGLAAGARPRNLLFIMTDQQRWDALGCAGNPVIRTPNLDRLAREGVLFENAYTACPVCVPARVALLTGRSILSTGVLGNGDIAKTDIPTLPTFDSVLAAGGYHAEYYGKWHAPYRYAAPYANHVKPTNRRDGGPGPTNVEAYRAYLDARCPRREPRADELLDAMSQRPYRPLPVDWRYGRDAAAIAAYGERYGQAKQGGRRSNPLTSQAGMVGCLQTAPDCSLAAFEGHEALEALDRLDPDRPFSLTCSFGPPHPPSLTPEPFAGMYRPEDMPVPESIDDPHKDSPHPPRANSPVLARYHDPRRVQEAKAAYYAMVSQVDVWVGKLLNKLDAKGLSRDTLVVFTSDHGEMLGDHGLHSKMVMFDGSAHIPLLLRLPGTISGGRRIGQPVSHLDVCPTILDYLGLPAPKTEGRSLRGLIEGDDTEPRAVVSCWGQLAGGGPLMIRRGTWKLILYVRPAGQRGGRGVNALYNLADDPLELRNRLGQAARTEEDLAVARALRTDLEAWVAATGHPLLTALRATTL